MIDCQFFGLDPMGHHLSALLLHLANTLILYWLLKRMTGCVWRSAFAAALFGIHPLHVESVAWVAERKDVLSTFFGLLAILAYVRYTEGPNLRRYTLILLTFSLSLMSKPMLVTLPLVLLMLDYWPLGRLRIEKKQFGRQWSLIREKMPLFALSLASCAVTFIAQSRGLAVGSMDQFSLGARLANSGVAYTAYLVKTVFPSNLAVFYPHPGDSLPFLNVLAAGFLLAVITLAVIRLAETRRYLAVGWLWYLVTLLPVIGLVQVGWQSMADRYTYVPLIGIFIAIAWGIPGLASSLRLPKLVLPAAACLVLIIFAACTHIQVGYWKDSTVLFQRALDVTKNNPVAHNNLGLALAAQAKLAEAEEHHLKAVAIKPGWADGHHNLGAVLLRQGKTDEAIAHLSVALEIHPEHSKARNNLGAAFLQKADFVKAVEHLSRAVDLSPKNSRARMNLGSALHQLGRTDEALDQFSHALEIDPESADTNYNLGWALAHEGRIDEAILRFRKVLSIEPDWPDALNNLAWLLLTRGSTDDISEALPLAEEAARLTGHQDTAILNTLAEARRRGGVTSEQ